MQPDSVTPPTGLLADSLLSEAVDLVASLRELTTVSGVIDLAAAFVWRSIPEAQLFLWMIDQSEKSVVLVQKRMPSENEHFVVPNVVPLDSGLGAFFAKGEFNDAVFIKAAELPDEIVWPSNMGLAFVTLKTQDGVPVIFGVSVPSSIDGDFTLHRPYYRMLAQTVMQAIEKIRLRAERDLLAAISTLSAGSQSAFDFFRCVAKHVADAFDAQGCSIFVYNEFCDGLTLAGTTGLFHLGTGDRFTQEEMQGLVYGRDDGLTGWIFANKKCVRLYDARSESALKRFDPPVSARFRSAEAPELTVRSFLGVPIVFGESLVGVIRLHGRNTPQYFLPSDETRLQGVSEVLGRFVANWRGVILARDQNHRDADLLGDLSVSIQENRGLRASLFAITQQAKLLLNGCAASVLLLDETGENLIVEFDDSNRPHVKGRVTVPIQTSLCGLAVRTKKPAISSNVKNDPRVYNPFPGSLALSDVASEACVPILVGDRVLGVLNVDSPQVNWFTERDTSKVHLLQRFAAYAAIAILDDSQMHRSTNILPARAIIHEVLNDLADMQGVVYSALHAPSPAPQIDALLCTIGERIDYWSDLRGFLAFDGPSPQRLHVSSAISSRPWLFKGRAAEQKIACDYEPENQDVDYIEIDNVEFFLILSNLVANAIAASQPGSQVTISSGADTDTVFLSVRDLGAGMAAETQSMVFKKPFTRRRGKGTGLLLVQRMVHRAGGTITFKSEVGIGTEFTVSFPRLEGITQ